MRIKMKPASVIEARLGIQNGGPAHAFFTAECARQMDPFVPWRLGNLAKTVVVDGQVTANVTTDTITYDQPYAKVVYYGIRKGKPIHINQNGGHPKATTYWDKHMWSAKKADITEAVQKYAETHGGK